MLTESRKRRYGCDDDEEEEETLHQAKRLPSNSFYPGLGHDIWDNNSSNSGSSDISSPEQSSRPGSIHPRTVEHTEKHFLHDSCNPCSAGHFDDKPEAPNKSVGKTVASYDQINYILREAHFSSLKIHNKKT